jgi:hypothetical protein
MGWLLWMVGSSVGGAIGGWVGSWLFGLWGGFLFGVVGMALGVYWARRTMMRSF